MEEETNSDIVSVVTGIYSEMGGPEQNEFFMDKITNGTGWQQYLTLIAYGDFLARMTDQSIIDKGVERVGEIGLEDGAQWWITMSVSSVLRDVQGMYEDRKSEMGEGADTSSLDERIEGIQKVLDEMEGE